MQRKPKEMKKKMSRNSSHGSNSSSTVPGAVGATVVSRDDEVEALLHHKDEMGNDDSPRSVVPLGIEQPKPAGPSSSSPPPPASSVASSRAEALKLLFGAGGIYAAFLYYGSLQEDVFRHESSAGDGTKFKQAWFLQAVEALANVGVGYLGRRFVGGTKNLPQTQFAVSGSSQVCAKAFTSLALANGLSFPVATLAKSAKMAPVMAGSLVLGGATYALREYLQVLAIIAGTALVGMGKPSSKKAGAPSSSLGVFFILASLTMDGVTGGVQKKLKREMAAINVQPLPYDFMYYTNLYMMAVAAVIALVLGEFATGLDYVGRNPDILGVIVKFAICSAVGQSFIFYTIAHFDPLVCSTVTTTRKIFSVLLSILFKGHALTGMGWSGLVLACSGILSEVAEKVNRSSSSKAVEMEKKGAGSPTAGGVGAAGGK